MTYDDLLLVNCAGCSTELVGETSAKQAKAEFGKKRWPASFPPAIGGRILGRPYCNSCLQITQPSTAVGAPTAEEDGAGPWHENAVRLLEGD